VRPHRFATDVARLPTHGFGPSSPMWWGTLAFIALEATGFVLAAAAYLFLASTNAEWPLGAPPPDPLPGTAVTLVLLASVAPNLWLDRTAKREALRPVRWGLVLMSLVGAVPLAIRALEFPALNVRWDDNAYGSMVWIILGLHTAHLLTDWADTLVLTALMFTRHARNGKRFSDVSDNCFYWHFVVASWVPLYLLLYGTPRL
jgi:cytochrome c oxidase subunit III